VNEKKFEKRLKKSFILRKRSYIGSIIKHTKNENKSKKCQLKCLDENQNRQLHFTVMSKDNNIVNNKKMKNAVIEYLENIIK
jgi:hypothetical protein